MSEDAKPTLQDVVVRAWTDEGFKAKLVADPKAALRELGADPPDDIELVVIESAPNRKVLVLPPPPPDLALLTPEEITAYIPRTNTSGGPTTFGGMPTCTRVGPGVPGLPRMPDTTLPRTNPRRP